MGEITEGRAQIEKDMAAQFAGPMKGSTHKLSVTKVYAVKPGVAVADGEAEIVVGNGAPWKANFTAVFGEDGNDNWILYHMRSYTFI